MYLLKKINFVKSVLHGDYASFVLWNYANIPIYINKTGNFGFSSFSSIENVDEMGPPNVMIGATVCL